MLGAARTEVASLTEELARTELKTVVPEVRHESEKRVVVMVVAFTDRSRAETLTRSLAAESVNDVDAMVQPLRHDDVSCLRQGPELAYLTVPMLCPADLTRACGVRAISIR